MKRTRIVQWLRLLLPLVALVILSTLFLFSKSPSEAPSIPYSTVDAEALASSQRMIAPKYAGVTSDGAEVTLDAAEVAPEQGGGGSATKSWLSLRMPDGLTAEVTSETATVANGQISLRDGVNISTSSGWKIEAQSVDASTDRSNLSAENGISAHAPFGELTAGAMELTRDQTDDAIGDAPAVLNFTNGVRLIYTP